MNKMKWWMWLVGFAYLLMGAGFIPALNAARMEMAFPLFQALPDSWEYKYFLDYSFMFGLDLMVIGVVLIYAGFKPHRHLTLVWLVVWLELIRGIFDDIYMLTRGYGTEIVYYAFIVFHLVIIITGIVFVRQLSPRVKIKVEDS